MTGRLSFDYVRRYYGVPAKRGMRVTVDGRPGRITSGNGHYIRVLFDDYRHPLNVHPTWRVVYETDTGPQTFWQEALSGESGNA